MLPRYHQAYADYFANFIKAYRRAGIPTHYVSMQNEPLYEPVDYPGHGRAAGPGGRRSSLATSARRWHASGLDDTKILGYDHNWDITDYPEAMYADRRVARQVAGTAWHCYAGRSSPSRSRTTTTRTPRPSRPSAPAVTGSASGRRRSS